MIPEILKFKLHRGYGDNRIMHVRELMLLISNIDLKGYNLKK